MANILKNDFMLRNLCYGHPGKFILSLSGRFDPLKMDETQPIQLGQMECGCWIVLDGNNRIGLILKENPGATIKILPDEFVSCSLKGQWDKNTAMWWNPYPKTFGLVMKYSSEINRIRRQKASYKNIEDYSSVRLF